MEKEKCLDTDALILVYSRNLKEKVSGYYTTCISLFEFLRGIAFLGKNVADFKRDLEENFTVLCLDNKSAITASRISAELRREGRPLSDPDLIIGSICIANGLRLVTNNARHFSRLKKFGLEVISADNLL
ncbi:type II toxin-antitoxin system VapC family toxin [Metallosphaera sedula]|uniref:type II toxin-antitoxin system VapC family toxin n=1 Tax=Metallosphaera sedula TaxID=43687 RepID=UPI0020BE6B7F|nr:type II toxin-antitoxin system VapC family toxin [Metallosphaera sedula]BBL46930.1 ribonuclease VapC4 [Metallosphaera sedula]